MSVSQVHLIERAAERLRQEGALDASAAQLLEVDRPASFRGGAPLPVGREGVRPPGPKVEAAVLERAGMLDWSKVRPRVAEELRIVQTQVVRAAFSAESTGAHLSNLVMVTSARPKEGKSFMALNLAASIARQNDHEVLLVNVDSKPGSLDESLGLGGGKGLLDLAEDPGLDPDHVIQRTALDKLSVLPLGSREERSHAVFATRQMARLIRDLGRRYGDRLVIIDAPPCLASSDPSTLAPIVGQIVLVVEAQKTQREEVEGALDLIQSCPMITLLLNKVRSSPRNAFGSYAASSPS